MANKKELIEAMKVIKEHCKAIKLHCDGCEIETKCNAYFKNTQELPEDWYLEDGESND